MKVPLLDLKAQYADIREDIRTAIDEVCEAQYFILGPKVEAFENHIAEYCGAEYAVGVSSGTDALLVALMAFDVGQGDAVITTPYTFFSTAGSIVRLGATPIFVDIDPVTYNIDPEKARETLKSMPKRFKNLKPKALIPVHLYGQMADMDPLLDLSKEYGLKVVEDAAQSIGAEYPSMACCRNRQRRSLGVRPLNFLRKLQGQTPSRGRAGSMGDIGCFSFFPSKNLGGFGDGGMVTTSDSELAEKVRKLRNHGAKPKYYHGLVGGNFRLDAIQAAILDVKLTRLELWHEARRVHAGRYDKAFEGSDICSPKAVHKDSGVRNYHIFNQYVVRIARRDKTRERLKTAEIGCEVYYPVPLHLQECFRDLGYKEGDLPESEKAARETLALPVYPELTPQMQDYVVECLKGVM